MGEIQERLAIVNQNCVFPIAYGKREDPEHHFFFWCSVTTTGV